MNTNRNRPNAHVAEARPGWGRRSDLAATLIAAALAWSGGAQAQGVPDVAFTPPTIHGLVVDNCAVWGTNCGWGGAHQFCQTQGYPAARSFQLNRPGRTYVIGANRACEGTRYVTLLTWDRQQGMFVGRRDARSQVQDNATTYMRPI